MDGTIYTCWATREELVAGEFAAICDYTSQRKVMSWDFRNTGQCHLYITRETIYFSQLSMLFRINSSYLEGANKIVQRLVEGGLLDHWLSQDLRYATQCLRPPTSDPYLLKQSLPFEALLGPAFMVFAGKL
ncbi:hypothetical protein Pcinc_021177 [Petrolisthes cinctipes]|nr:hypothetical protein Pcinc_021177 [Petrolisthes cinctipes]